MLPATVSDPHPSNGVRTLGQTRLRSSRPQASCQLPGAGTVEEKVPFIMFQIRHARAGQHYRVRHAHKAHTGIDEHQPMSPPAVLL